MNRKKTGWEGVAAGILACVLTACSPSVDVAEADQPSLTGDLAAMQGAWISDSDAAAVSGKAVVDEFRVVLSYRHEGSEILQRNSFVFERVDERRKCFVMHENRGAWPYSLERENGQLSMSLEFLCADCKEWHRVRFHRQQDAVARAE